MEEETYDNTSYQSTSKKLLLTPSSNQFGNEQHNHNLNNTQYAFYQGDEIGCQEFTSETLHRLLALMEGEVEARDDCIEHLKKERMKILLAEAKYGKLSMNDPFAALRRDSAITGEQLNEGQIEQMYESQVDKLEKLIDAQKKSLKNTALLFSALEKKHWKLVKKLEADRNAKIRYAEQGDDLVAMLEKERNNLNKTIDFHIEEKRKAEIENDKLMMKMGAEKRNHEAIVMYLMHERKQMLLKIHELRVNAEQLLQQKNQQNASSSTSVQDRELIEELKKEVTFLRGERESLTKTQKMMKAENLSLKETIKGQEVDLMLLRKNMNMSGGKGAIIEKAGTILPQLAPDGGSLIVANRGATTAVIRPSTSAAQSIASASSQITTTKLSNSSSFPVEKSRLPRVPITNSGTVPRTLIGAVGTVSGSRTMSSPVKKTPIMGVSSTNRRPQTSSGSISHSSVITNNSVAHVPTTIAPELEQLEAAIQSMNVLTNSSISSPSQRASSAPNGSLRIVKRSSSLPREENNNPRAAKKNGKVISSSMTSGVVTTRIASPSTSSASERKMSGTVKRNGLLAKAFGSSSSKS